MSRTDKPLSRGGSTICAKHDKIFEMCAEATLEDVYDVLEDIKDIAEAAREDGQNMENAIYRWKTECENLQKCVDELEQQLREAQNNE